MRGVRVVPAGLCNWAVASIKPLTQGDARNALTLMLAASKQAMPKYAVVVDDDIDIFDDEQLYWAMSWRSQPHEDTLILTDMKAVNARSVITHVDAAGDYFENGDRRDLFRLAEIGLISSAVILLFSSLGLQIKPRLSRLHWMNGCWTSLLGTGRAISTIS